MLCPDVALLLACLLRALLHNFLLSVDCLLFLFIVINVTIYISQPSRSIKAVVLMISLLSVSQDGQIPEAYSLQKLLPRSDEVSLGIGTRASAYMRSLRGPRVTITALSSAGCLAQHDIRIHPGRTCHQIIYTTLTYSILLSL